MVADLVAIAEDDWWVIGSAAVVLHGASRVHAADVDIVMSERDACRCLLSICVDPAPGVASERFRSVVFGRWEVPPLEVEIMAGFRFQMESSWADVRPTTRDRVDVDGAALFIPSRSELSSMLRGFGRSKDEARARRLDGDAQ